MAWQGYDANGNPIAGQSAGVLGVANGGTGLSTVTAGVLLLGAGTSALTELPGANDGDIPRWNAGGSAWEAAALDSPMSQIAAPTRLGGTAANIDLTSISGAFYNLRLLLELRSDRAGNNFDNVYLRFNGDSTASNYNTYGLRIAGSTNVQTVLQRIAATATGVEIEFGATAATATAGRLSLLIVDILGYAQSTYPRRLLWKLYTDSANSNGNITISSGGGTWLNTANAITQITILPVAGSNWAAGTAYALYGIGDAA